MAQSPNTLIDNALANVFKSALDVTNEKSFVNLKLTGVDVDKERNVIWFTFFHNNQRYAASIPIVDNVNCDYVVDLIKSKFNYSHL
jgi:hypothetical protein